MTQHERADRVRVVQKYDVDTLGAPFKVTLLDSVSVSIDPKTGDERVEIPDLVGLINAVVRSRVLCPRKLSGKEIKFVRNALGVRAKPLAQFLDMTPEHLSRCEAGTKVMSGASEKVFRLFAYLGTFYKEPKHLFVRKNEDITGFYNLDEKKKKNVEDFVKIFLTLKIQPVFDQAEELHFEFTRRADMHLPDVPEGDNDDGEWFDPTLKVA